MITTFSRRWTLVAESETKDAKVWEGKMILHEASSLDDKVLGKDLLIRAHKGEE